MTGYHVQAFLWGCIFGAGGVTVLWDTDVRYVEHPAVNFHEPMVVPVEDGCVVMLPHGLRRCSVEYLDWTTLRTRGY